jgi:HEAT repeat protein
MPGRAYADAVDDLKQALQINAQADLTNPTKMVLDFRRDTLQKRIDKLRTTSELRRALLLEEWKDTSDLVASPELRELDIEMRRQVGTQLTKALQRIVETGNAVGRLAAANTIAEIGPTMRSTVAGEQGGFARGLTSLVIQLATDKNLGVRQEGLRALGNIFPKPDDAVPVFQAALTKDALGPRRLAAEGLGQLIRVVNHLRPVKRGITGTTQSASPQKAGDLKERLEKMDAVVIETMAAVLAGNSAGLHDTDSLVRKYCLENIQVAAETLADITPNPFPAKEFPPEGRPLSAAERTNALAYHEFVQADLKKCAAAMDKLREQGPALIQALSDPDSQVRLAALDALQEVAIARRGLKRLVYSVPVITGAANGGDLGNREFLTKHDLLESFLPDGLGAVAKLLGDPEALIRRKAVEVLDVLEEDAVPVLPALTRSLSDPDRSVRRAAARAIGNIGTKEAAVAVPGLARLLSDPDLSIRLAAAKTLKDMGPLAKVAAAALATACASGDVEARVAAMDALQAIGAENAKVAVPNLILGLGHMDARVKRAAAKTLGSIGPAAAPALRALANAIGDEDQEVRTNASDAILEIQQREGN